MLFEFELERSVYKNVSFFAEDEEGAMDIADKLARDFADNISRGLDCDDEMYDFHLVWVGDEEE